MTEHPERNGLSDIPEAVSEPHRRYSIQLVWIIPILAALIGLSLAVKTIVDRGEMITITFKSGEGMEAGKTKLKYKDVQIGEVKEIAISRDRSHVVVKAEMTRDAKELLVKDTRFWVVRPRITGGNVSGLSTLIGGPYIGVDVGTSTERQGNFIGLDNPPAIAMDVPGRQFVLHGPDVGSLDTSSPIFFRRIQVGQVTSTELDADGKGVTIKAFVRAPYDQFVKPSTVFWQASGVDLSLTPSGVKVNSESLVSILMGGVAFMTTPEQMQDTAAAPNSAFTLFATKDEALKQAEVVQPFLLIFKESVRGLAVGAPVDLRGVTVGEVTRIDVALKNGNSEITMPVQIRLYPERLKSQYKALGKGAGKGRAADFRTQLDSLVAHGFRAEVKSGNLITGSLYVSLDFAPKAPREKIDWSSSPPRFPTVQGSMGELQKKLTHIVEKIEAMPLEELGKDARKSLKSLDQTLQSAEKLLKSVDASVVPEARGVLTEARGSLQDLRKTLAEARQTLGGANQVLSGDGSLQLDLRETMREVQRAAQSLRVLGDYLEQHPESLIRGKKEDKR